MLSRLLRCVVALASLCLAPNASAQNYLYEAGSPAYGVNIPIENGFINVTNGNLHMEFPLAQHPQRGDLKLNESLVYDSHFWKVGHYSNSYWWPDNLPRNTHLAAGWRFVSGADTGAVNIGGATSEETPCAGADDVPAAHNENYTIQGFTWTDPDGTAHYFDAQFTYNGGDCTYIPTNPETQYSVATDGSGLSMTIIGDTRNGPSSYSIRNNSGQQLYPIIADRYGNFWTKDSSGNLIDDRGQTPVVVSYNGNQIYYDVLRQGGGRARYTVTTVQVTPHTQFNKSGVNEYPYAGNDQILNAVQSLQLPDGSTYEFAYESTFGMLTNVTLPTGGQIAYGWMTFQDSFGNKNRWIASRTAASDAASTFTPAIVTVCSAGGFGCHETVTVHEPMGDETRYDLVLNNGAWNANSKRYAGTVSSGTLVSSTDTTYDFSNPCFVACTGAKYIVKQSVTTTLADTSIKRTDAYTYSNQPLALISAKKVYDFYTGNLPSQPMQQTQYTYAGTGVANDLSELRQTDGIGTGNAVSIKKYTYTTSAQSTSNLSGHDMQQSLGVYLQSVGDWVSTDGSYLTTTLSMDDAGTVLSSTDPNGTTTYGHDGSDTFVTSTTLPTPSSGVSMTSTILADSTTGVPNSATDANNQTASYQGYDALNRVGEIDYPNGGSTTFSRTPTTAFVYTKQTSSQNSTDGTQFDEFGRLSRTAKATGTSVPWYQKDTCYNSNGQVEYVSFPYAGPGWSQAKSCSGSAGTSFTYDALGRPVTISNADGSTQYSYMGRATKVTDVNGKQTITQIDGLGRISAVCEVSSQNVVGSSPVNCNLDISGSGYLTTYAYDLVNHKTTITQDSQTRVFQTDSVGRTVYTSEPERGNTTYGYAYNSIGLLVKRTRPKANQQGSDTTITNTQYDRLGRVASVSYENGGNTPEKHYYYDQADGSSIGLSLTNLKGHLASAATSDASTWYSYDAMGRPVQTAQCFPGRCGTNNFLDVRSYNYDFAGNRTQEGYTPHLASVGEFQTYFTYSPAGEVTSITNNRGGVANANGHILSSVVNLAAGPQSYTFGNGLTGEREYDGMQRNWGRYVCSGGPAYECQGAVQVHGVENAYRGARVTGMSDTAVITGVNIGYDDFDRLKSVSSTQNGSPMTWSYDRYGNRTAQNGNGPQPQFSFDTATNHISSYSYDSAGNLIADGLHTYTYDAESNLVGVDNGQAAYYYDALNQRVRSDTSAGSRDYAFNVDGKRVATWDGGSSSPSLLNAQTYWNGQPVAYWQSGGGTAQAAGPEGFIHCADESGTCSVPRAAQVAYGANGAYLYQSFSAPGSTSCSNSTFGSDPASGTAKACFYAFSSLSVQAPGGYVYCADESGTCSFGNAAYVAYGANGSFVYQGFSGAGSTSCSTSSFGSDPATGTAKACFYRLANGSTAIVPPTGYVYCASEGDSCSFSGQASIAYGANGSFLTVNASSSVSCSTATFGSDPANGTVKACFYHQAGSNGGAGTHFLHADLLGTIRVQTSSTGTTESVFRSLPFGDGYTPSGADGDASHFAELDHDPESGTSHATFRQYSSTQGRWMSPDPYDGSYDLSNPQSLNRYSYVNNNPFSGTDPDGLEGPPSFGPIGGCVGAVASGGTAITADLSCAFGLYRLLFGDPSILKAGPSIRPNGNGNVNGGNTADPWNESLGYPKGGPQLGGGWGVTGALGLPIDQGCEFGACGGGESFGPGMCRVYCAVGHAESELQKDVTVATIVGLAAYDLTKMQFNSQIESMKKAGQSALKGLSCAQQWTEAYATCSDLITRPQASRVRGITGGYKDIQSCARGLVTEECGGNKIDWGR